MKVRRKIFQKQLSLRGLKPTLAFVLIRKEAQVSQTFFSH